MSQPAATILRADAEHLPLADRSVDMAFGSPPYCDARTYDDGTLPAGLTVSRGCVQWIEWMLCCTAEAQRVCRGPVLWVAAGVTRHRNYWPACEGLMWEWWKRGGDCQLYRPCYWQRNGIFGSGGDDWFRADVEYVLCFKRPGKLPWSNNVAMGHPPKYAPGGEASYRLTDGTRRNQWGGHESSNAGARRANGARDKKWRPSHREKTKRQANGETEAQRYRPPVLANPGNLIHTNVGGGHMGHSLAHDNEAPFPEKLAEWFILSLCPPGGTVLDPFAGSGTTGAVALANGRNAILVDIRESQCELMQRRLASTQLNLLPAQESTP